MTTNVRVMAGMPPLESRPVDFTSVGKPASHAVDGENLST
jgi:hypothetical protein